MNTLSPSPGLVGASATAVGDDVLWQHRLLCELALPLRSTGESWSRHAVSSSIAIEPHSPDRAVPSGTFLRLALLRVFDAAVRARAPVVELGDGPSAWAAAFGIELSGGELRNLALQLDRLTGCRVTISVHGGAALTVFDARSRPRAGESGWVASVRLNGRFLADLLDTAVPLSRTAVGHLWRTPDALDAYAWAVGELHRGGGIDEHASWEDLRQRFGQPSRGAAAFRAGFEEALRAAADADPSMAIKVDETGVKVGRNAPGNVLQAPRDERAASDDVEPVLRALPEVIPGPADLAQAEQGGEAWPELEPKPRSVASGHEGGEPAPASPLPDPISLSSGQTGVSGVVWLRHGRGEESALVGVTPGSRLDLARLTVLAVEPTVLQVSGGLPERDFGQVAAWIMANRDLIDDVWEGRVNSVEEVEARVQRLRAPTWR